MGYKKGPVGHMKVSTENKAVGYMAEGSAAYMSALNQNADAKSGEEMKLSNENIDFPSFRKDEIPGSTRETNIQRLQSLKNSYRRMRQADSTSTADSGIGTFNPGVYDRRVAQINQALKNPNELAVNSQANKFRSAKKNFLERQERRGY